MIKGEAAGTFLRWYARSVDEARVLQVLRSLQYQNRDWASLAGAALRAPGGRLHGLARWDWYPAAFIHALIDGLLEGIPDSQHQGMADIAAQYVMSKTIPGVFEVIFSVIATPELYARHGQKFWRLHYDNGELVFDRRGDESYRVQFRHWGSHHSFICRLNMAAIVPIYRAMGHAGAGYERLTCTAEGDPTCELRAWFR